MYIMSTRNDGISRFEASTVYAPVTFTSPVTFPGGVGGAISCTTLTASGAISGLSVAATNAVTAGSAAITGLLSAASIECVSYSSALARMTLTSGLGVYLSGTLTEQDEQNPPAALILADVPFCASYLVTAPRAFILPAGSPQGFRATFYVGAAVVVTFTSPDTVIANFRNTNAGLVFAELNAGVATPNLGQDDFIQVTSANGRYVVMSFAV